MSNILCARHKRLLERRLANPDDRALAAARVLDVFACTQRVDRVLGNDVAPSLVGNAGRLLGVLEIWGPACCFLGDEVVNRVVDLSTPEPAAT